jgi:hypothetical protein
MDFSLSFFEFPNNHWSLLQCSSERGFLDCTAKIFFSEDSKKEIIKIYQKLNMKLF